MMEVASITGHKTMQMLNRYNHHKAEELAKKLNNHHKAEELAKLD